MGGNISARLGAEFKEAGMNVSKSQIDELTSGYLKGLRKGKHYNTAAAWLEKYAEAMPLTAGLKRPLTKWLAQAVDESLVLAADGLMRDQIRAKVTREDEYPHKADPVGSLIHSVLLGGAFPALRAGMGIAPLKWGGKEKLSDAAKILYRGWRKVDYSNLAKTSQGRAELRGFLSILNGTKQKSVSYTHLRAHET